MSHRLGKPHLARRAFSLIELLVAISIIALLVSILLPVIGSAREAGRQTQCLANQRTIAQGWFVILSERKWVIPDNQRNFFLDTPAGLTDHQEPSWGQLLKQQFPDAPRLQFTGAAGFNACPTVQNQFGKRVSYFPGPPEQRFYWGYAFNVWWQDGAPVSSDKEELLPFYNAGKSFDAIRATGRYPLFMDTDIKLNTPGYFWGYLETPVWDSPWATPSLGFGRPHGGTGNVSFADGSAHAVTQDQVMDGASALAPFDAPFFAND